jgi:hypothetical protein
VHSTHGNDKHSVEDTPSQAAFPSESSVTKAAFVSFLLQFIFSVVAFRVMGLYRLMDVDEGHFLSAVRCVYDGLAPCRDFFFQQMPLFPYPYAAAMWIFGYGYEPCIWVSVLSGAGLAVVTSAWFARHGGGVSAGWVGWCLVMLNAPILFWTPTVKNHALPLFLGVLALYSASRCCKSKGPTFWWAALAGFAAMGSVGTRLLALPFAVMAGSWILARVIAQPRSSMAWCGLAGFLLGTLPPGLLILRSVLPHPWVFYFDVLGFHAIRSGRLGTFGTWQSVRAELAEMFYQGQFPVMLAIAWAVSFWDVVHYFSQTSHRPLAQSKQAVWTFPCSLPALIPAWLTIFGVGAAVLALLPAQTFHQYFMVPLMFFILAGLPFWCVLLRARKPVGIFGVPVLLALYGGTPWNDSIELFNHREWVFPRLPRELRLADVREISQTLAEVTNPNDPVFTTWQGFTFFARRRDLPGNENFIARVIAGQLPDDQLRRLHVASNAELTAAIRQGEPKAVVLGFFVLFYKNVLFDRDSVTGKYVLRREFLERYKLVRQIGSHQVWLRK